MAIAAVLALGAGGCGQNTIPIAEISDAGIDAAPILCTLSDAGTGIGCPDASFCEATKCPGKATEGTEGTCAPIPSDSCANDFSYAPQCGCDGVTYFNECLRREKGVSTASTTSCDLQAVVPAKPCAPARRDDPDCPTCAAILSSQLLTLLGDAGASALRDTCAFRSTSGICWVTPTCTSLSPASGAHLVSLSCPGHCEDACLAIRAGGPLTQCVPDDAGPD